MNTMEDKIYGSDLEDRLLALKRSLRLAELESSLQSYESQQDYEESTK